MQAARSFDPSAGAPSDAVAESNHRIANNLAALSIILQRQAQTLEAGPEMVPAKLASGRMLEMAARIAALGRLHRLLSTPATASEVELGQVLTELVEGYHSTGMFGERLNVTMNVGGVRIATKDAWILMQVITEIATNAAKYAHPTGLPVELSIAAARTVAGGLILHIADDGVGLPEAFDEQRDAGHGLRLVRGLVEHAGGRVAISSGPLGLSFSIELPAQQTHSSFTTPADSGMAASSGPCGLAHPRPPH